MTQVSLLRMIAAAGMAVVLGGCGGDDAPDAITAEVVATRSVSTPTVAGAHARLITHTMPSRLGGSTRATTLLSVPAGSCRRQLAGRRLGAWYDDRGAQVLRAEPDAGHARRGSPPKASPAATTRSSSFLCMPWSRSSKAAAMPRPALRVHERVALDHRRRGGGSKRRQPIEALGRGRPFRRRAQGAVLQRYLDEAPGPTSAAGGVGAVCQYRRVRRPLDAMRVAIRPTPACTPPSRTSSSACSPPRCRRRAARRSTSRR